MEQKPGLEAILDAYLTACEQLMKACMEQQQHFYEMLECYPDMKKRWEEGILEPLRNDAGGKEVGGGQAAKEEMEFFIKTDMDRESYERAVLEEAEKECSKFQKQMDHGGR